MQLAGPMDHDWLPQTSQGRMVGDYMSVSFAGGLFFPFFVNAHAPTAGGNDCELATPNCDVAMVTTAGIAPSRGTVATSANDRVIGSAPARRGGRAKIR